MKITGGEVRAFPKIKIEEKADAGSTEDAIMQILEERLAQVEEYVLKKPAQSVAIALVAGFLLGLISKRSR